MEECHAASGGGEESWDPVRLWNYFTGGEAFDGFSSSAPFDKIAVAVIDCGGTARVGVYPMKKVKTVDIHATSPAGPLAQFITEELFVSGVKPEDVEEA